MKTAFITGITGQDGHHLTKLLLNNGYRVVGMVNGQRNVAESSFRKLFPNVELVNGDLADFSSLLSILAKVKPDEIYNLGAISFVTMSFSQPEITANITGLGALRLFEAVRSLGLFQTKIYQASSSEMFGKVNEVPQTETTAFYPRSPYGVAKVFAHNMSVNYREAYNIHISCGILFNHEGEYRGHEFVTRKITSNIARIKLGKQERFQLGALHPMRDWGYAGDYVEAMWLMLQQEIPSDYVIATGEMHSVKEFVEKAIEAAGLTGGIEDYVDLDKSLLRPSEVEILCGDASKAKQELGWAPSTSFDQLVELMIENDLKLNSK